MYVGNLEKDLVVAMEKAKFDEKRRDILCCYYGIGTDRKTLDQLSKEYGLSRARIGQIKNSAVNKISKIQDIKKNILEFKKVEKILRKMVGFDDIVLGKKIGKSPKRKESFYVLFYIEKIKAITFSNPQQYIEDVQNLEDEISGTDLTEKSKARLSKIFALKKELIVDKYGEALLGYIGFEEGNFERRRASNLCNYSVNYTEIREQENHILDVLTNKVLLIGFDSETTALILESIEKKRNETRAEGIEYYRGKMKQKEDKMATPLETLPLPEKVMRVFGVHGIKTLGQFLSLRKKDIYSARSVGRKSAEKILEGIEKLGYELPEDDDTPIIEHNRYTIRYADSIGDFKRLAEEIKNSQLDDDAKALLLGELYEYSVGNLRRLYNELELEENGHQKSIDAVEIIPKECRLVGYQRKTEEGIRNVENIKSIKEKIKNEIDSIGGNEQEK